MGQLVKLRTGQVHVKMLGAFCGGCDKRQVDIGGHGAGKFLLGLLRRLFQPLHGHLVPGQIHALSLLELLNHPLGNLIVKVVAAQEGVAIGSQHRDNALCDLDDGYIEGAASQVVHHNVLFLLIVQAVSQGSSGGLIDNPLHIQARDLARVLGSLALGIVEVRRNGDHRFRHLLAQITLCVCLQLLQNHSGNLLGRVLLVVNGPFLIRTHLSLNGRDGFLRVGHCLTLGRLTDQPLAGLGESHHGRGGPGALRIGDNGGFTTFHHSHTAIGRTQVNTDNLTHVLVLLVL